MSSERAQWEDVKNNYLQLIQQSLASLNHPRRFEILGNVEEHLEGKYAELPKEKRTWESYQQIITEMGPPAEYAALLCDDIRHAHRSRVNWFLLIAGVIITGLLIVTTYLVIVSQTTGKLRQSSPETSTPVKQALPSKTKAFELDEKVLGEWFSVDFVDVMEKFDPNQKSWQGELFLKSLNFNNQGSVEWCAGDNEHRTYRQWTKGKLDPNETIPGLYTIRPTDGIDYLFIEWISGDVTIRGQKPKYYVLTRKPEKVPFNLEATSKKTPEIPIEDTNEAASSAIKPPQVIQPAPAIVPTIFGKWIVVDYVPKTDHYCPVIDY